MKCASAWRRLQVGCVTVCIQIKEHVIVKICILARLVCATESARRQPPPHAHNAGTCILSALLANNFAPGSAGQGSAESRLRAPGWQSGRLAGERGFSNCCMRILMDLTCVLKSIFCSICGTIVVQLSSCEEAIGCSQCASGHRWVRRGHEPPWFLLLTRKTPCCQRFEHHVESY